MASLSILMLVLMLYLFLASLFVESINTSVEWNDMTETEHIKSSTVV